MPDLSSNGSTSLLQGLVSPQVHQTSASSTCPMPNIPGTTGLVTRCPGSTTLLAPQANPLQEAPTPTTSRPQLCLAPTSLLPRSLLPNRKLTPKERPKTGAWRVDGLRGGSMMASRLEAAKRSDSSEEHLQRHGLRPRGPSRFKLQLFGYLPLCLTPLPLRLTFYTRQPHHQLSSPNSFRQPS